jgi:hypothetical protein
MAQLPKPRNALEKFAKDLVDDFGFDLLKENPKEFELVGTGIDNIHFSREGNEIKFIFSLRRATKTIVISTRSVKAISMISEATDHRYENGRWITNASLSVSRQEIVSVKIFRKNKMITISIYKK